MSLTFFAKYPNPKEGRRSFSIMRKGPDGCLAVKDVRIAAINKMYKAGAQTPEACTQQIRDLVHEYQKARPDSEARYLDANLDLRERYWKEHYSWRTGLRRANSIISAKSALNRTLDALGSLSIVAAPINELQKAVAQLEAKKQTKVALYLNLLLKFTGRPERVEARTVFKEGVRHLTWPEFQTVLPKIKAPDAVILVIKVAYATGCRLGEIFALRKYDPSEGMVYVGAQMDEAGAIVATKNKKTGWVPVLEDGLGWVAEWMMVPWEERQKLRRSKDYREALRKACKEVFPQRTEKHCVFHDLRHSYAIFCRDAGVDTGLLANSLRDDVAVVQKYYIGSAHTPATIGLVRKILKKKTD